MVRIVHLGKFSCVGVVPALKRERFCHLGAIILPSVQPPCWWVSPLNCPQIDTCISNFTLFNDYCNYLLTDSLFTCSLSRTQRLASTTIYFDECP